MVRSTRIAAVVITASIFISAVPVHAGIEYEFRKTTRSDVNNIAPANVRGKAWVDGDRSRVDYIAGSVYPKGNYVLQLDGAQRMVVIDPESKTFQEWSLSNVAAAMGAAPLVVSNLKTELTKGEDHPVIAGYPTDHYTLQQSYEMTITYGTVSLTQKVQTVIDRWVTTSFGNIAESFLSNGALQTGNTELDRIISEESSKIPGFKLRETIAVVTTAVKAPNSNSQVKLNPVRRQSSEFVITSAKQVEVDPALLEIPAGFTRASTARPENRSPVHMLSMEPAEEAKP